MKTPATKRRARLTAPPGKCPYCDRRNKYLRTAMARMRQRRAAAPQPQAKEPTP